MVRHVSNLVNVTGTEPVSVYSVPSERNVKIKKIMMYNKDAAANTVLIYDGDSQRLPAITIDASAMKILGELDLPSAEFYNSISVALGSAGTNGVDIVVEVEEEGA